MRLRISRRVLGAHQHLGSPIERRDRLLPAQVENRRERCQGGGKSFAKDLKLRGRARERARGHAKEEPDVAQLGRGKALLKVDDVAAVAQRFGQFSQRDPAQRAVRGQRSVRPRHFVPQVIDGPKAGAGPLAGRRQPGEIPQQPHSIHPKEHAQVEDEEPHRRHPAPLLATPVRGNVPVN